ncbi:thiolase family protein [Neobacillus sp. PS2-9]|uniref:thiolase family protein n=1 Tax=Neobacillus sp. PS2-9 TaxID=3070676 RepID=UPI0027DEBFFA|nr:thiolase family protein [Neobacillus sp. PS2-9]WML57100.1 thiolase family protein [Neobacillus sp. PS2-9]
MREAVVVEAVRTPIGKRKGIFKNIRSDDLVAQVLQELVRRTQISAESIEDVIMGCVSQVSEQSGDIGRVAALIAGYPITVPGTTIDRQCGSSQQAVHFAAQAIISGDMDVVVAAGVENMSRVPMFSSIQGAELSKGLTSNYEIINQGLSAELIAEKWNISQDDMNQFAVGSHQKAIQAIREGRFEREIIPIFGEDGQVFNQDECPRSNSTLGDLRKLSPSFKKNGFIHPGISSPISDGAAAVLIMSREKANELGLKPRCRIIARTVVGSDPTLMLTGPIPATEKVLNKAGLSLEDIDIFEVNEAFASVPISWLKETGADPKKLNPNGGAIALGHPLGASGARLFVTMLNELERIGGRYGLQTMCEGLGMANALIIERLD